MVGDRLARLVRHEAGRVPRLLPRAADPELEAVRRPGLAARDARHRVLAADDVGVDGGGRGELLSVERPGPAAELARPAAVGRVVARELALREDALVDLGGGADQVPEAHVHRAPAVLAAHGVAVRGDRVGRVVDEEPPGARVGAEDHGRHADLVDLRAAAVGDDRLERLGDRLADLGARVMRPRRHRAAGRRVQTAALGHHQLDRTEEALVLGNRRVHHGGELRDHVAARVAERRVGLDLGARVGAREVDRQAVALHGHRAVEVDVGVPLRVVVDVDVRFVHAVAPAADLLAEAARRELDHLLDRAPDRRGAVARQHLLQPPDAELRRTHLRAQIAHEGRRAVVDAHEVGEVAPLAPALVELEGRETHPLRPDVGRVGVVPARHAAAGVGVVALDGGDQDQLARVKDGREDVVVGQVAAAVVGVVGDQHVAVVEPARPEELEREADGEGGGEHELRDADAERRERARAIQDGRVALVRLVQDRRRRGETHVGRHLVGDRLHGAADDLGGDGVEPSAQARRAGRAHEARSRTARHRRSDSTDDRGMRKACRTRRGSWTRG